MKTFFQKRLIDPLLNFLKQGASPHKLALAVALGMSLGIIPLLGITTMLCAGTALIFRLNMPAIQLVNFFFYPLQLVLFIPFFQAGAWVFGGEGLAIPVSELLEMIAVDPLATISRFWWGNVKALLLWSIVVPFPALAIYFSFRWFFQRVPLPTKAE